jgi:hypothetical protein
LAVVVAAPILWQYFKWFFDDLSGFISDASLGGLPDWYAFLKDKYWEGEWAEVKIFFFLLLCVGFTASLYKAATLIFY